MIPDALNEALANYLRTGIFKPDPPAEPPPKPEPTERERHDRDVARVGKMLVAAVNGGPAEEPPNRDPGVEAAAKLRQEAAAELKMARDELEKFVADIRAAKQTEEQEPQDDDTE